MPSIQAGLQILSSTAVGIETVISTIATNIATQLGLIARYSRSAPDTRRGETLKPEAVDAFVARARLDLQIPARR